MSSGFVAIIGTAVLLAYYAGRGVARWRLPALIGFMLVGVALGPSGLHWFDELSLGKLSFLTDLALGFVAFSIGQELRLADLKRLGRSIGVIIVAESFAAFLLVFAGVYALTRDLCMALVFGAMAPASAPAGTVAVIQEYRAKGSLTKALFAVVGFDDGLAILIFGLAAAAARAMLLREGMQAGATVGAGLAASVVEIGASVGVGVVLGVLLCVLIRFVREDREILIVTLGVVLIGIGVAARFHLSLILANLVVGFVFVNTRSEADVRRTAEQVLGVMPVLFVLFFCLAGAHLNLSVLPKLGVLGLVYILCRSAGLIGGSMLAAHACRADEKIRKYIGIGILSQAGVAIALALTVQREFAGLGSAGHGDHIGTAVITTVTATSIVFEIIGPILTKYALTKAGEIPGRS